MMRQMPGHTARPLLAALFILAVAGASPAAERRLDPAVAESLATQTDDPLVAADLYNDAWLNRKAIEVLEASGAEDAETLWRLARSHINLGETLPDDEALPLYLQARKEAERAVQLDPNSPDAHLSLAIALGREALFRGVFKSLGLVKGVRREAHLAAALGDSIPAAWYVLGRTHKKLVEKPAIIRKPLGIGWAKRDSVRIYFDKALEVSHGNMIQCRVEYAEFLLDRKEEDRAREMLEAALALPLRDEQDVPARERAEKMLEELK